MIKLWNVKNFVSSSVNSQIEPYFCFREHTGPLFAVHGFKSPENASNSIIFTAGSEGIIKCWNIPDSGQIDSYSPTEKHNFYLNSWNCHEEAIW